MRALVAVAVMAVACAGVAVLLLSDDGGAPAPARGDATELPGSGAAMAPVRERPLAGRPTANCRRRALGPGDLEGAGRRDFAPRCVVGRRSRLP